MSSLSTSVLIPSFQRYGKLSQCLQSIAQQSLLPDEVIIVWQGDDSGTRDVVLSLQNTLPYALKQLHCSDVDLMCAENIALEAAQGEIILLCDDDVIVSSQWVSRHLSFYSDQKIGAVGGSANIVSPDFAPFPRRNNGPIGKLTWYGRVYGNMYDHPSEWIIREPMEVDHLVGYNLSFRRCAVDRFENGLKPYWQMFELDICLQVKARGYRVVFDFANVVNHYLTNAVYDSDRKGDIQIKFSNAAYNQAFILAKHGPRYLRFCRLVYLLAIGSSRTPGILAFLLAIFRYKNPIRELEIFLQCFRSKIAGWKNGGKAS